MCPLTKTDVGKQYNRPHILARCLFVCYSRAHSWSPKVSHNGKPWSGPDQFEDSTGQLMMLPTDIMLIAEPSFKKWVEIYAKDEVRPNCFRNEVDSAFVESPIADHIGISFIIIAFVVCRTSSSKTLHRRLPSFWHWAHQHLLSSPSPGINSGRPNEIARSTIVDTFVPMAHIM